MTAVDPTRTSSDVAFENLRQELRRGAIVLAVLARLETEHYGYALRKALVEQGLEVDENTLYPLLRRLETQGLLDSTWRETDSRPKRFYRLSPVGEEVLGRLLGQWTDLDAAIRRLREELRMTIVERYLRAVRDNLPRGQQDDIINELNDSIQSRFEDEEAALGRPLGEAEEAAILKGFGHPMTVAARYRGDERSLTFGRQLIGPELFPTYLKVLWINLVVTLVIAAISIVASGSIWSGIAGFLVPFAIQFVAVTAIFIGVNYRWVRNPDAWDPRTVASMGSDVDVSSLDGIATQMIGKPHSRAVPVTTSVLEIGLLGVALAAWLVIGLPQQIGAFVPGSGLGGALRSGDRDLRRGAAHPGRQPHPADVGPVPRRRACGGRRRDDRARSWSRWRWAAGSSWPIPRRRPPTPSSSAT